MELFGSRVEVSVEERDGLVNHRLVSHLHLRLSCHRKDSIDEVHSMFPCSKLQVEFLSVIEQVLEAILLFSLKKISQVLDGVVLEVLRVTSIQETFFSLFILRLEIFLLLLNRRVILDQAVEVDLDKLLDDFILQRPMAVFRVEAFNH